MGVPSKKTATNWRKISKNAPTSKYPPLVQQLLKKYPKPYGAAKACGFTGAGWLNKFAHGQPFTDEAKAIVERALRGEPPIKAATRNGTPATAFVIVKSDRFEQLYDMAQLMGGKWPFKRKTGREYVGVLVMPGNEMGPFVALAKAKGAEVFIA